MRRVLRSLPLRSFLDVACGTGFMTQHLPGRVVGLDQSLSMLQVARTRVPALIQGEAYPPYKNGLPHYVRLKNVAVPKRLATAFTV